jgi:hypothetical protein
MIEGSSVLRRALRAARSKGPWYVFTVVMKTTLSYAGLVCILTLVLENDRIPATMWRLVLVEDAFV